MSFVLRHRIVLNFFLSSDVEGDLQGGDLQYMYSTAANLGGRGRQLMFSSVYNLSFPPDITYSTFHIVLHRISLPQKRFR
jgi:hypothetical protein